MLDVHQPQRPQSEKIENQTVKLECKYSQIFAVLYQLKRTRRSWLLTAVGVETPKPCIHAAGSGMIEVDAHLGSVEMNIEYGIL